MKVTWHARTEKLRHGTSVHRFALVMVSTRIIHVPRITAHYESKLSLLQIAIARFERGLPGKRDMPCLQQPTA